MIAVLLHCIISVPRHRPSAACRRYECSGHLAAALAGRSLMARIVLPPSIFCWTTLPFPIQFISLTILCHRLLCTGTITLLLQLQLDLVGPLSVYIVYITLDSNPGW